MHCRALYSRAALSCLSLFVGACFNTDESRDDLSFDVYDDKITRVLMTESFERADLLIAEPLPSLFSWRAFIWDYGQAVLGPTGRNVAAVIMGDDTMGASAHGSRALYLYGREGSSIHTLYLFTTTYDLSEFSEVDIAFKYLLVDLNDGGDSHEFLRLDVCADTAEACGAGTNVNHTGLGSASWTTIYEGDDGAMRAGLNGKNHLASDWAQVGVKVNIADFPKKDTFTFRISARMNDGFISDNLTKNMEDGAAVDDIRVSASVSADPVNNGPEDPECTPEVSRAERPSCYDVVYDIYDNPMGI
jgi:hypothetical protein